eukprot:TRINITY_DN1536_c0_g1_i1.p1 TRINITY_DN1536_c0_g1~~TRINITY_DN1536_c0_g1_i1.p1  ORF type:complete len:348 (-),score=62.57 TRINITY_DN1536_c0_g1_i1:246-1289(-)
MAGLHCPPLFLEKTRRYTPTPLRSRSTTSSSNCPESATQLTSPRSTASGTSESSSSSAQGGRLECQSQCVSSSLPAANVDAAATPSMLWPQTPTPGNPAVSCDYSFAMPPLPCESRMDPHPDESMTAYQIVMPQCAVLPVAQGAAEIPAGLTLMWPTSTDYADSQNQILQNVEAQAVTMAESILEPTAFQADCSNEIAWQQPQQQTEDPQTDLSQWFMLQQVSHSCQIYQPETEALHTTYQPETEALHTTPPLSEVAEFTTTALPSLGSELHGTGQCKPCAWLFKSRGCQNALSCEYCHLCPEGELKNRKKAKVAAIRMGVLAPRPSPLHSKGSKNQNASLKLNQLL